MREESAITTVAAAKSPYDTGSRRNTTTTSAIAMTAHPTWSNGPIRSWSKNSESAFAIPVNGSTVRPRWIASAWMRYGSRRSPVRSRVQSEEHERAERSRHDREDAFDAAPDAGGAEAAPRFDRGRYRDHDTERAGERGERAEEPGRGEAVGAKHEEGRDREQEEHRLGVAPDHDEGRRRDAREPRGAARSLDVARLAHHEAVDQQREAERAHVGQEHERHLRGPGRDHVERPRGERVEREEPVRLGIGGVAEPGDRVVDAGIPPDEGDLRVAGQGAARILVDHEARRPEACEHDDTGEDPGRERVSERERATFPDLRGSHGRSL